jgi:hypothetical protein
MNLKYLLAGTVSIKDWLIIKKGKSNIAPDGQQVSMAGRSDERDPL